MRYGMVINLKKCVGCQACSIACKAENSTGPGIFWGRVLDKEVGTYPSVTRHILPHLCMHCREPRCVKVCPTGASSQREDGIVVIDYDKCVGCRYCIVACPYQARYYNNEKRGYFGVKLTPYEEFGYQRHQVGVAEKCTFCVEKVERGEEPACVQVCPAKARYFGDLDDPGSNVSRLIKERHAFQNHPEYGTDPSVYYIR